MLHDHHYTALQQDQLVPNDPFFNPYKMKSSFWKSHVVAVLLIMILLIKNLRSKQKSAKCFSGKLKQKI